MMYFYKIAILEDTPESSCVYTYCDQCGANDLIELGKFEELIDGEYVRLKPGNILKCRKCGKEHEKEKILYQQKPEHLTSHNIPRCPVCGSAKLERIKTSSKILAGATVGVFALPYTSKTFTCKSCGYKF